MYIRAKLLLFILKLFRVEYDELTNAWYLLYRNNKKRLPNP